MGLPSCFHSRMWFGGRVTGTVALLALVAGCGANIEVSVDSPFEEEPSRTPFDVSDLRGLAVQPYVAPTPLPPLPPRQTFAGWEVQPDGNLVRISFSGDGTYSFGVDGEVVHVADTSVHMDTRDLTGWRLSRRELATVLGALDAVGVRDAVPGEFGSSDYGPGVAVFFGEGRVTSGNDERLLSVAREVTRAPAGGARPWVPEEIGFLAGPPNRTGRSPLPPDAPFRPWPLRKGIWELSTSTAPNAYGETRLSVCVTGRAAAKVWRRLFTGANTAWLRVDDGEKWELDATVEVPGFERFGSPCG